MKTVVSLIVFVTCSVFVMTGCSTTEGTAPSPLQSSTIPKEFHGKWTHHSTGLHPAGGEEPWVLAAKTFQAHETYADVRSVTIHGSDAITVILDVSSEGEEYTEERYLELSRDGNRLVMKVAEGGPASLYRVR